MASFKDKWLRIGLSTGDCNLLESIAAAKLIYQAAGLMPPTLFFLADSPLSGALFASILVVDQVWAQVRAQVVDQVWAQVRDQVGAQVRDQVQAQVREQVRAQVRDQVGVQIFGCHDGYWLSFYDYMQTVLGIDCSKLNGLMALAHHCGWWTPFKGAVIFQHKPDYIHWANGVLHKDGGAAIQYRDGFAVYCLHGVRVPEWLAVEPAGNIDPTRIVDLSNAQIRAEFVRKIGYERICYKLGAKLLDHRTFTINGTDLPYDLIELSSLRWRFLKMQNPSVPELWHIEGVPTEINSVTEAMNFRNSLTEDEIDDTIGVEWYQQGDVILRPVGAKKFRRLPSVLT